MAQVDCKLIVINTRDMMAERYLGRTCTHCVQLVTVAGIVKVIEAVRTDPETATPFLIRYLVAERRQAHVASLARTQGR